MKAIEALEKFGESMQQLAAMGAASTEALAQLAKPLEDLYMAEKSFGDQIKASASALTAGCPAPPCILDEIDHCITHTAGDHPTLNVPLSEFIAHPNLYAEAKAYAASRGMALKVTQTTPTAMLKQQQQQKALEAAIEQKKAELFKNYHEKKLGTGTYTIDFANPIDDAVLDALGLRRHTPAPAAPPPSAPSRSRRIRLEE